MLLLFVGGVMNLLWIAALMIIVLLEKLAPGARWIARGAGLVAIGAGIWLLGHAAGGARA
jgi:predicted metal-binding membrane protein